MKIMQNALKTNKKHNVLFQLFVVIVAIAIIALFADMFFDLFNQKRTDNSMEKLYFFATVLVTCLVAWIAYNQLHGINQTAKHDFMFRILKLYQSREILKARTIIHEAHLAAVTRDGMTEEEIRNLISQKLLDIKKDKVSTSAEKFVYINNLLELMEDLSYYANNDLINKDNVTGLKSGSILYFHDVLKGLIQDRRKHDSDYYSEFDSLVKYLKAKKLAKQLELNVR